MNKPQHASTLTLNRASPAGPRNRAAHPAPAAAAPESGSAKRDGSAPVIKSESLLQGGTQLQIVHNGATYHLRATRLGKLILTK